MSIAAIWVIMSATSWCLTIGHFTGRDPVTIGNVNPRPAVAILCSFVPAVMLAISIPLTHYRGLRFQLF